ncbi:BstXI family restriction endonuclease [Croceicoccus marinus]|uniref:Restriction endonuclease n=1 Tax=Croceicoccus marinus TaxID=450378 RepID=A0A1Z1FD05_9SPHN|nr:BstXI family restriction endonuclease [Croceicoccus marinus]ARU16577.1 restriction endonuclease [Croceicoccus marinus]
MARPPKLPKLLERKIYKTGQTRGADDDQIWQNRVGRNSTVLIPLAVWRAHQTVRQLNYENGYIILVPPPEYFEGGGAAVLKAEGIQVGQNALVFYELRAHWNRWSPADHGLTAPNSRTAPLGGQYVARIANTTAAGDQRINHGYTTTGLKGAGIRLYEYAPTDVIYSARVQLEALFWLAEDSIQTCVEVGMDEQDVGMRRKTVLADAASRGLLDFNALREARTVDHDQKLVCPLCLERLSSLGFMSRMEQAAGRERHDLTVTEINLFHIKELAFGLFNHRPYNLGWGHHHCNVVCKDSGIGETLDWMKEVLKRNQELLGE